MEHLNLVLSKFLFFYNSLKVKMILIYPNQMCINLELKNYIKKFHRI